MNVTNLTSQDIYFGPIHLLPNASNFYVDDTTATSLYLRNDSVAEAVNNALAAGKIQVTSAALPFPRPTGTPQLLHGDGWPEGLVFAPQGSVFMRRDNVGANNSLYAKTSGASFSTGWQALAAAAPVLPATTLPGSPADGQQALLVDSTSAPTYSWLLQYNAAASKWFFIGGTPAIIVTAQSPSTTSASFVDFTGNSVTISRAGDYFFSVWTVATVNSNTNAPSLGLQLVVNGVSKQVINQTPGGLSGSGESLTLERLVTGIGASQVAKLQIICNGGGSGQQSTANNLEFWYYPRSLT